MVVGLQTLSNGDHHHHLGNGDTHVNGSASSFSNPIITGLAADPTILRVGDDYFLATSSFEYFPGVPIYHSKDLVNWKVIGHALTRRSQLNLWSVHSGGGIFAPSLRYYKGRYYMTTANIFRTIAGAIEGDLSPRGFFVWTENIWDSSSWSDPIFFDVRGIDQDIFFDDKDDKAYLLCSRPTFEAGQYYSAESIICEIDIKTGRSKTKPKSIRRSSCPISVAEAPHIFKRDGVYYLITAEGGTEDDHQEWVCRSTEGPYGPWTVGPKGVVNPMVHNPSGAVTATGHMDFVEAADGQWWAVLLALRPTASGPNKHDASKGNWSTSQLGRETFLAPVDWVDGWPIVNKRKPITTEGPPGYQLSKILPKHTKETFTFAPGRDLYVDGWVHLRTPSTLFEYDMETRPGSMGLIGGPYNWKDDECTTILLQKQTAFVGIWSCDIEFKPDQPGLEAFTTAWWSRDAFASIGLRSKGQNGEKEVVFRKPRMTEEVIFDEETRSIDSDATIRCRIKTDFKGWSFSYTELSQYGEEGQWTEFGNVATDLLVRDRSIDSNFVGTHLGIYAAGVEHHASMVPAYFSNVTWEASPWEHPR